MRVFLLAPLFLTALPAMAQQAPSAPPTATAAAPAAPVKPKLICETEEVIGSRVGGHKVCMTAEQWREQRRNSQDAADQAVRSPRF